MDISSIIIVSIFLKYLVFLDLCIPEGSNNPGISLKNEWIVWPPTLRAATPVGARTTIFFLEVSLNSLSRVDFPVPALPVMKKLSPEFSSTSSVFLNELFNIKGSFIMPVYFFVNEMKTGKWSLNP